VSRIAYFDCFSGISGDMVLGALLDAGGDAGVLDRVLAVLSLEEEVSIEIRREERGHIGGQRVVVRAGEGSVRSLVELQRLVSDAAEIPERARNRELGVEQVYASPLPAERGLNGELPLPAPAALQLLADAGAMLEPVEGGLELVTPTGAAFLAVSARFERPALRPRAIGYGVGGRDRPGNLLRVWLGDSSDRSEDTVVVLETNLDDMAGNVLAALVEDLMQAGALDVSIVPALMKKGRPGHLVTVLAAPDVSPAVTDLLLRRSSTLGVRVSETRRVLAERQVIEVATELGAARVKVKYLDGRAVEWAPEYEDARRLARESGRELREVMRLVSEAARRG